MAHNPYRTGFVADESDGAKLMFNRSQKHLWTLHYEPAPQAIRIAKQIDSAFTPPTQPILLLRGNAKTDLIVSYPLNTTATSHDFLTAKHDSLRTITFEKFNFFPPPEDVQDVADWLLSLPTGFVKSPYFGLGLNYELRYLTVPIRQIPGVSDLRIRRGPRKGLPTVGGGSYVTSAKLFDEARKAINRIHSKALDVASDEKTVFAHNALLTALDSKKYPERARPYRKNAILEAIGSHVGRSILLSESDQKAVVSAAISSAKRLRRTEPEALLSLKTEIELVTLEELLVRMKVLLDKKHSEATWQKFFRSNPFILKLAFGHPVMLVEGQISVGGRKFVGGGEKISDFAVKASASGNLALIEIKTPETALVERSTYRGDLHAPSRELSGAVNQILDQRYQLQKSIANLKDASGIWDVETYAVQGLVIAGRRPRDKPEIKSLELFRNALKSVTVVTFDELVGKLDQILEILKSNASLPDNTAGS